MIREARKLLKEIYGYENFRRGQEIIVDSVLSKRDTPRCNEYRWWKIYMLSSTSTSI